MGQILVNPSLGQTLTANPALGQTQKLYSGGSNTVLKYLPQGGATPTQITDLSGHGNHAAFTATPEPVLTAGKWCYQFVSASSEYCTIPDITELLGATAATWCAYVRKDAYVANQGITSDNNSSAGNKHWTLGYESAQNLWSVWAGNGNTQVNATVSGVYTVGWHFVWMRFTASSATGLETGCDNSIATPTSTSAIAALGAASNNITRIGRTVNVYSSMTLGALAIWAATGSTAGAISDAAISQWRWAQKARLGL